MTMLSLKEILDANRIIHADDSRDILRHSAEQLQTNLVVCDRYMPPGLFAVETDDDYDRDRGKLLSAPTVHMHRAVADTTADGSVLLYVLGKTYIVDIDPVRTAGSLKSAAMQIIDECSGQQHTFIVAGSDPAEHEYALGLQYKTGWTFVRIHHGKWSEEGEAEMVGNQTSLLHHKLLM